MEKYEFSFEYCIDTEVHKTKVEEYSDNSQEAIAVEGAIKAKALTGCQGLGG